MSPGAAAPVPFTLARHWGWSWMPPGRDMGFARDLPGVPPGIGEPVRAATAFPLVLRRARDGAPGIEAVLRPGDGPVTPFVGPDGAWRAPYLPRALRHAPFDVREIGTGQLALLIDEANPLVRQDGTGQPFFAADGAPDPSLAPVQADLRAVVADRAADRAACEAIEAAGLLRPLEPEAGALMLIHAQILSMGHCDWLRRA